MTSAKRTRICLLDDDAKYASAIEPRINAAPDLECVGAFDDPTTAIEKILAVHPDVLLLDIRMPKLSGIGCIQQLIRKAPDLKILMLTVYVEPERILDALQLGAAGYLSKNERREDLLATIRRVAAGELVLTPEVSWVIEQHLKRQGQPSASRLTPREEEILFLASSGRSNQQIADALFVSTHTVNNHFRHILSKLRAASRTQAVWKWHFGRSPRPTA